MRTPMRSLIAILTLALVLPGCLFDPDIEEVVLAIEQEIEPATLHPEATVNVGRGLLTVARALVGFVPDSDVREARTLLKGIHEVHVGIYTVEGLDDDIKISSNVIDRLSDDGWQAVVNMHEDGSTIFVFGQMKRDKLGGVYVVIHEDDELVVAKLKGNLSQTIDIAIRQAMQRNPDMFDPMLDATEG